MEKLDSGVNNIFHGKNKHQQLNKSGRLFCMLEIFREFESN